MTLSDDGTQLRWKGQLGASANILIRDTPNPPCQHSLWEETGIPGENPGLSVER